MEINKTKVSKYIFKFNMFMIFVFSMSIVNLSKQEICGKSDNNLTPVENSN